MDGLNVIDSFSGEHRFLSNFYPSVIDVSGVKYPTLEHAFQAMKTDIIQERDEIRQAETPGKAKKLGRKATMRPTWNDERIDVMRMLVRKKFEDKVLLSELLATQEAELIEGNTWGDQFWGVSGGKGENWLGKILMEVRAEQRSLLKA